MRQIKTAAINQLAAGWTALAVSILICFAAAAIGAWLSALALRQWYSALKKPAWTPPDAVFGPVWSVLYLSMAIAAWLVWRRRSSHDVGFALGLFALQLVLNVAWSGLFFGLHSPATALIDIVFLWFAIAGTVAAFNRVSALSGWIMVPYLAWVSFAAVLNFAIWRLNRMI